MNLILSESFKKLIKTHSLVVKKLEKTLDLLIADPFYPSLHTHKVDTKRNKDVWSSRITGDWRLAWVFDDETKNVTIICLEIGTHSERNQIYPTKSN